MSEEQEGEVTYKVADRRKFNADGSVKEGVTLDAAPPPRPREEPKAVPPAAASDISASEPPPFDTSEVSAARIVAAAPTAAGVTVAGRVTDESGRGLRGALVALTSMDGKTMTMRTSSMGYFSFADILAGQSYIASVAAAGREFDSRVIHVSDSMSNLDFSPRPR